MTVPSVNYTVLNGRLGVRPPGGVECHACVGPCSAGTVAHPTRHVRVEDLLATYVSGPAAELAARAIAGWKGDVLMVRATAGTAASFETIDTTGVAGTSAVTKHADASSDDDYEAVVRVVHGGTVGTAGITYQTSLDAGRSWSPVTALGTANTLTIANSGTIKFALAAGTLVAGDTWSIVAHAPACTASNLTTALASLTASSQPWTSVWIGSPVDATIAAALSTWLDTVASTTGKAHKIYCAFRMPDPGETEADYLDAFTTEFDGFSDKRITICAGAARVLSARPGRAFVYRRPALYAIAGLPAALPLGVDMAQVVDATPNGLPGVSLYDSNGNPVEHDEMLNPGLSDVRALTLRTWPDKAGVFVNNPVTLEQPGGDFHLDQHVRILTVFCNTARKVLVDELSRALDLNRTTNGANVAGAPTERECQRIEARVMAKLEDALKTQVSGLEFRLHRDDQVLVSQTLSADGGILFKGYPKQINFTVSAINPAAG